MSVRPMAGRPNPGRGGDGRRLRWSESPVPRVAVRRTRSAKLSLLQEVTLSSQLFGEFAPVTPSDDYYFVANCAVGIESPDDTIDNTTHYWSVESFTGSLLTPSSQQDDPWHLYWVLHGSPNTDTTITDPDWFLVPMADGGPVEYSTDVLVTALTLRVANTNHVGQFVSREVYGLDQQAFIFPTLSVPFTITDSFA